MRAGTKTMLVFIVMGAMSGGPVFADERKSDDRSSRLDKRIERVDTNKDGKLSLQETVARATERFDASDADGDGEISLEEMVAIVEKRRLERQARRMLRRMDFDGDGKVTKSEIESRARKRFALMDRNDDGFVEKSELRRSREMRGGRTWRRGYNRHRRHHRGDEL